MTFGFTMAEILLSLTIIGVVAAITLPSLTGNINERTWNTQRKALYARFSQAIALMPALNGYGTLETVSDSSGSTSIEDTAAEAFITEGLSKVLKINNICDSEHIEDCGLASQITTLNGSTISTPETMSALNSKMLKGNDNYYGTPFSYLNAKAAAFETQNGESIVAFYNQNCRTEYLNQEILTNDGNAFGFPHSNMCVNFIYDLNGNKGPNTVGKDIGIMTVFNATDSSVVAPLPSSASNAGGTTYSWYNAAKACTTHDSESRSPNIEELSSMLINQTLIDITASADFWSSSVYDTQRAWTITTSLGIRDTDLKSAERYVRCIKR